VCPFIRQNGGDSLLQKEAYPIPQLFHIALWIHKKNPFRTNFFRLTLISLNSQPGDAKSVARMTLKLSFDGETFYIESLLWYILLDNEIRKRAQLLVEIGI